MISSGVVNEANSPASTRKTSDDGQHRDHRQLGSGALLLDVGARQLPGEPAGAFMPASEARTSRLARAVPPRSTAASTIEPGAG
jgi:hypothetical protein